MPGNNARIGGILSIVSGAFSVLWIFGIVVSIFMFQFMFTDSFYGYGDPPPHMFVTWMTAFYSVLAGFLGIAGILAIVGGIFAIKRKNWGLALAGIAFKMFFAGKYSLFSTIMYVLMGWIIVFAIKPLIGALPAAGFRWLLAGGLSYTTGAVLYTSRETITSWLQSAPS